LSDQAVARVRWKRKQKPCTQTGKFPAIGEQTTASSSPREQFDRPVDGKVSRERLEVSMDGTLLPIYGLEEQGAAIKVGTNGRGLPDGWGDRVAGGSETAALMDGSEQAIAKGDVVAKPSFKVVEPHRALLDEHCSGHPVESALLEVFWDIGRIGVVVDAQPRTILAGTIEEKGSWKEFEHLLGMLLVVLPGLLVADEFIWIIHDGFEALDLCIPPIDRERIAIFGDEIAELALWDFGDTLSPEMAAGAVGTLDRGIEKRRLLLCSLALIGHEHGDSLLKDEIILGVYGGAEQKGKNRRGSEKKDADPLNKVLSNSHI
jgi:hypothetical protein